MNKGIKKGLVIAIGYFPIGMAFGILAKANAITILQVLGFSGIVFAGASQFIAVSMIALNVSAVEITVATFFLNFRHFLMSASIYEKLKPLSKVKRFFISFFITDETYAIASFDENLESRWMIWMEVVAYTGWVIGSLVGHLAGSVLPSILQEAMQFGLYAMFIALLVPEVKGNYKQGIIAVFAGAINSFLQMVLNLQVGWSIIISMIFVSLVATLLSEKMEVHHE